MPGHGIYVRAITGYQNGIETDRTQCPLAHCGMLHHSIGNA